MDNAMAASRSFFIGGYSGGTRQNQRVTARRPCLSPNRKKSEFKIRDVVLLLGRKTDRQLSMHDICYLLYRSAAAARSGLKTATANVAATRSRTIMTENTTTQLFVAS